MSDNSMDDVRAFELRVGNVSSPDGQTSVTVERDGTFIVRHEAREGDERTKEPVREEQRGDVREVLDVGPEQLLVHAAAAVGAGDDDFPQRPGVPDEAIVHILLRTSGGERTRRLWIGDAERDRAAGQLLVPLRTLVERATDGRRYL